MSTRGHILNVLILALVILPGLPSLSQNNCAGSPAYGTCAAPAAPVQVWCAGNNLASTCLGGKSWVGFSTTTPASSSWTNEFEGISAGSILASGHVAGAQADPNGGVGPTNLNGVGQYLEFADNFVQAFDKQTGTGTFSGQPNGTAAPMPISTLFSGGAASFCTNPSLDGIGTYDRIDGAFVLANIFSSHGSYYLCAGVSAPSGSIPASNLRGTNGQSFWNAYVYRLNPAIPLNPVGFLYFPDYLRFGTWGDGFYISWDLEDPSANFSIVGFEVCKLDKQDMLAGLSSSSPQCYTFIPSYAAGAAGTGRSLIHTLLPSDFEGANPIPATTAGEYFLALVNPSNVGTTNQCTVSPCTSAQLAFWTWNGFTTGAGPTFISLAGHAFTPGCYNIKAPYNTYCIPEPFGRTIDGLGDRLGYRLAYRNIVGATNVETLAVAHTVQENTATKRTGIRFYKIVAGASPRVVFAGDIQDKVNFNFLSMPSVAMDKTGNLGITFTETGSTARGSLTNFDPSPYFVTVDTKAVQGTPVAILSNTGSSGQDETDQYWGEYVSVSSDPDNDATFWAANQYMNGDQITNCSYRLAVGSGCTWASKVFTCQKGSGC